MNAHRVVSIHVYADSGLAVLQSGWVAKLMATVPRNLAHVARLLLRGRNFLLFGSIATCKLNISLVLCIP